MNLTEKFKKKYIAGYDCRLSTFRNSLAAQDVVISNSMALGISGSLIFCFNDGSIYSRLPFFVVAGINDQSLEAMAFNLNIYLLRGRMFDMPQAKEQIKTFLKLGICLNVAINRQLLQQILGIETHQINMGHHYLTLTDYDVIKNIFTLIETDSSKEIQLNEQQLQAIWFSDLNKKRDGIDPFQLCDGQWYSFFVNKEINNADLIEASYSGIRKVLMNFFKSPAAFIYGKIALVNFQSTVASWKNDIQNFSKHRQSIKIMEAMESGMSGGGLGRKLYGYFLSEFSLLIEDKPLKEIAYEFTDLGKAWKDFTVELVSFAENKRPDHDAFEEVISNLDRVINLEICAMEKLKMWFNNHSRRNYGIEV